MAEPLISLGLHMVLSGSHKVINLLASGLSGSRVVLLLGLLLLVAIFICWALVCYHFIFGVLSCVGTDGPQTLPYRITSLFLSAKAMISRSPACLCETLGDTSVSECQHHYGGARPYKNIWDISEIQPYVVGVLDACWLQ